MTLSQNQAEVLWQQISSLRPKLRSNIVIQPQEFRGERWYMLQDRSSGRYCRVNELAYSFIARLDGSLSVSEVYELINSNGSESTQLDSDAILALIAQLHDIEILKGGLPLSLSEALVRYKNNNLKKFKQSWGNPLAIKIALLDPEKLLVKLTPFARLVFSKVGFLAWFSVFVISLVVLLINKENLFEDINVFNFSGEQIFLIWLLYPLIKALHELGHGLATKAWGGEVHEAGVMFLLFLPVPYVDASASWAFRDNRKRALVASAGILVELAIASFGLIVWSMTSPGIVNALALNAVLIGGISTLLYNGNPLLRFDGYYVLEDILQIPNLGSRSTRYYLYAIQKYLLGIKSSLSPVTAMGERPWFVLYGFLSPTYRLFVLFGIAYYLGHHFLGVGILIATWAAYIQIGKPLYSACKFILTSRLLRQRRRRSYSIVCVATVLLAGLMLVPMPLISQIEGVVWLNDSSRVYAHSEGQVEAEYISSGTRVKKGDSLLDLRNEELSLELLQAKLSLEALQTEHYVAQKSSRLSGAMVMADITTAKATVSDLEQRERGLHITSPVEGRFVYTDPHRLNQKYVKNGDVVGYIVTDEQPLVRAVIDQNRVHLLERGLSEVEVVLVDQIDKVHTAKLVHQVPGSSNILPSPALGTAGGGKIPVDHSDDSGTKTIQDVYQLDFRLPESVNSRSLGTRAYLRLTHGKEPLISQWGRELRQLFISLLPD